MITQNTQVFHSLKNDVLLSISSTKKGYPEERGYPLIIWLYEMSLFNV